MRESNEILIVSCYELGHQPLAAASALGFLDQAGYRPVAVDLAVESLETFEQRDRWRRLQLIAISVPMHTALHVGVRAARRLRLVAPRAHICFYGLYAILNAEHLLQTGLADSVMGGEFEESLVDLAAALHDDSPLEQVAGLWLAERPARPLLKRLTFPVPRRGPLPELGRYAKLEANGETRLAAAVETSRGCLHLCRHCPIPPVYAGRFFIVPRTVVLEDIRQLVRDGATHITFSDPDFFNGPGHALGIVRGMHEEFPALTFDVTTKVEHILKHRTRWDELAACGCAFVVSAVESLSNTVLRHLMKGHTKEDVFTALSILRSAGIPMRPSLVAFTPWTRLEDFQETLSWIDRDNLIRNIDLVQFSIRLLIPPGSHLVELDAMLPHLVELEQERFSYIWKHPDPRMDQLHSEVSAIVQDAALRQEDSERTFERIWDAAFAVDRATSLPPITRFLPARAAVAPPRLTEPWFC